MTDTVVLLTLIKRYDMFTTFILCKTILQLFLLNNLIYVLL